MPVPKVGQKVKIIVPIYLDGIVDLYHFPERTRGTVAEVFLKGGLAIGIDIDKEQFHLSEGEKESLKDCLHVYHNNTGNGNRFYIYSSANYIHNGSPLAGLFEFHHHFQYIK